MKLIPEYQTIYVPQKGPGADLFYGDCGPASVMQFRILNTLRTGAPLTVDTTVNSMARHILKFTKPDEPPDYAGVGELMILGLRYGIKFEHRAGVKLDDIRSEIDEGRPVLPIVVYSHFKSRTDPFKGGHFLTVVGYDDDHMILNCPLQGAGWVVPVEEFEKAYNPGQNPYFWNMRQVLFWRNP